MLRTIIASSIAPALAVAALALSGPAQAAGGGGTVTDVEFSFEGPFGTYDRMQLQRGFQVYHQVCASCHGLKYVAFRDLGRADGPAFPEEQIRAIAAEYEVPDTGEEAQPGDMRQALPSDKFPANNLMGAPDLSLMAKARAGFHGPYGLGLNQLFKGTGGAEYIYSLLTSYTGNDTSVGGAILYENTAFIAGNYIAMAQPLYGDDVEYGTFGEGGGYVPPEATIEQQSKDVAAFLMRAAEPTMVERKEAGLRNLIWLVILAVLLYFTNRKVWAPVKGEH
jgi:ubiquinol-cytochrome c reductase cytochrome c1 subunit